MKPRLLPLLVAALLPAIVLPQTLLNPLTQPQFQHPLPQPPVRDMRGGGTLTLPIKQVQQHLGLQHPVSKVGMATTVWTYDGTYPGPTILARKDVPVRVYYPNKLVDEQGKPLSHLLPIDESIHWALGKHTDWKRHGVPIVTHLHGGHTESASDGLPEAWYTPNFALKGKQFVKGDAEPYHYSNDQDAATIWYHDHALGITRLNVYAGLAGFYVITDGQEQQLQAENKLPQAPYDLGLAIQDRMFTSEGQLYIPSAPPVPGAPNPSILPEFFGDHILVNGVIWPILEVEPRPYRFRVLNGSDSRFYNLFLSSGQSFVQVGTDDGLLPSPVSLSKMLLGPGERRDVVVDFSGLHGQTIIMRNNAKTPFPSGVPADPRTTGRIMAFRVTKPLNSAIPKAVLPATLRPPITPLQTNLPARKLILFEGMDELGRMKPMLGTFAEGIKPWYAPVTENPALNSTEIWEIYNQTEDAHPIHLHLVRMQLLNRQKFRGDVDGMSGKPMNVRLVGNPKTPDADEAGWKDTYVMYPGEVTRVIANFDLEGAYVWHCHILSHEDHEMMRPFYVGEMPEGDHHHPDITHMSVSEEKELSLTLLPNPFSSELKVLMHLPKTTTVMMNVYDSKGALMKQVFQGKRDAGVQQFTVDGSAWSNGVYFLELIMDGRRATRKLVLRK